MRGKKDRTKDTAEEKLTCFKCGAEVTPHTLYCPKCNRRQPILMEGLDRAYDENLSERIKILDRELEGDRKNYYRHFILGNALYLAGDYNGAVHRYRMALDLKPDFGDAMLNLGYVLSLLGDGNGAIDMLEKFRTGHPHSNKVEGATRLIYELKGIPWHPSKPMPAAVPEVIKPGIGRRDVSLHRERVHLPSLIFVLLILALVVFGLVRGDVVKAAYGRTANTVGDFLSGHVSSEQLQADKSGEESAAEGKEGKEGGDTLLSRLFGRRKAEEKIEDEGSIEGENPAKGPPVESPGGTGKEEQKPKSDEPINLNPTSESYWPMEPGDEWRYKGIELDYQGNKVEESDKDGSIKVIKKVKGDQVPVYQVNNLGSTTYLYETNKGIFQARDAEHIGASSGPLLSKPVVVGDKWTDTKLGMGYEVVAEINLNVPAGYFRVMRIKTWLTDYPDMVTEIFFGKGIGPVKLVTGSARKGFRVWELKSYPES